MICICMYLRKILKVNIYFICNFIGLLMVYMYSIVDLGFLDFEYLVKLLYKY